MLCTIFVSIKKGCTKSYDLLNKNVQAISKKPRQILEFNSLFLYEN